MSLLANKVTAICLAGALGSISIAPISRVISTQHKEITNQHTTPTTQNYTQQNEIKKEANSSFIKKMNPYIKVKNGKYILNNDVYNNKTITQADIKKAQISIEQANEIAKNSATENELNVIKGTTINPKQNINTPQYNNFEEIVGTSGIKYFWWGVYIYLNNEQTQWLQGIGTAAAGVALGVLFPGVGGVIAGVAASLLATGASMNSPETEYGCVISVQYPGIPNDIWAQ